MGVQISEKPLVSCGCRKFQIDPLGDHITSTCTVHSGVKKAHDWVVDQLADLFRTTHKAKTQQVIRNRGHHCGDIDLVGYLANETGPVSLVLDLRIPHDPCPSPKPRPRPHPPPYCRHLHPPRRRRRRRRRNNNIRFNRTMLMSLISIISSTGVGHPPSPPDPSDTLLIFIESEAHT